MRIIPYLCVYSYKVHGMYFVQYSILDGGSSLVYVCLVRTWFWDGDLIWSDGCETSCVYALAH